MRTQVRLAIFGVAILFFIGLAGGKAFADNGFRKYEDVFPSFDPVSKSRFPPIDGLAVYPKTSPEYGAFYHCQTTADKTANCDPNAFAYFFNLSSGTGTTDAFDMLNHCISLSFGKRISKGPIRVTPTGLSCEAVGEEVVMAQVAACYQRQTGTFCRFATLCFEGDKAKGRCTRDYPAEDLYVARNSNR